MAVTLATPERIAHEQAWIPETFVASDMDSELLIRSRAAQFIGDVLADRYVSVEPIIETNNETSIVSLHDALQQAHTDPANITARRLIERNAGTDVIERTIKKGHVMMKVPLIVTATGTLLQHGQSVDDVQANSLRLVENPIMLARTEAEARNKFRTEQYYQEGWFNNYSLLVVSRAEKLPGFFAETMSCSLQLTSMAAEKVDGLTLESAFVAGVAAEGEPAHDEQTAIALGAMLGADYRGLTTAEIIDTPILIRNDLIPNGVVDVVKLWDKATGLGTFFGELKPSQDYLVYRQLCHEREAAFQPKIKQITDELIAAAPRIRDQQQAVQLLNDISGLHMVELAVADTTIDSRVFGEEASQYIDQARMARMHGDFMAAEELQQKAQKTERSTACPSGINDKDSDVSDEDQPTDDDADCEFTSKECPVCRTKNVKTVVQSMRSSGLKRISGSCGCVKFANSEK